MQNSTQAQEISLIAASTIYLLVIIGFFIRYSLKNRLLQSRKKQFVQFAAQNKYTYDDDTINGREGWIEPQAFGFMSLRLLNESRDFRFFNHITSPEWEYCDCRYSIYNRTKYGDYEAVRIYYSVMSVKLPRELPNVFFDSHIARKRQFRFNFSHNQIHSLEGDFDKYFTTYFPEDYTIDSMSFIGPDVMEAIKDAANYDIEISGSHLFLYGPLIPPAEQLHDMAEKISNIHKQLMTEIKAYDDERLPGNLGRKKVAEAGQALRRSTFRRNMSIGVSVVYVVFILWNEFRRIR